VRSVFPSLSNPQDFHDFHGEPERVKKSAQALVNSALSMISKKFWFKALDEIIEILFIYLCHQFLGGDMKAITIRLTEVQEKQIERFANSKRITFTEATRLAAISFLENEGKAETEKAEHEKTRAKFADLDHALASQTEDIQAIKKMIHELGKMLVAVAAPKLGVQK
jgi:hypothetical protein